jgi:signal transduction histidine kinase
MKFLNYLSLGKKIYLLLGVGLVVSIGVFSFLATRAVQESTEAMLEDRLTTTRLVASYLDETLRRADAELDSAVNALQGGQPDDVSSRPIADLTSDFSRLSLSLCGAYLLDNSGAITRDFFNGTFPAGTAIAVPADMSLTVQDTYISGLTTDPLTDTPVVMFFHPLDGSAGYLVVEVDISHSSIGSFVRPIQLGETGYVEIVDQNGIVVARTEPGPALSPFEKSDHAGRFAALISADEPTRGLCHTCHEPTQTVEQRDVLAFMPMTVAHWGAVIRQSETEALGPVNNLRRNLVIFGACLTAAAIIVVYVTTRDVLNRLKVLATATRSIAAGKLDDAIAITKHDEVGLLAESFEDMRAKLKTYYGDLEQRTNELAYLLSISDILSQSPGFINFNAALKHVVERTLEITRTGCGSIVLFEEGQLVLAVNLGLYRNRKPGAVLRQDDTISTLAVQTGKPVMTDDLRKDVRFPGGDRRLTADIRGFLSVPILSEENVAGVLNIASRQARAFSPEDVRLLEGIARQIATALENTRLQKEVQHKEELRGELLRDMFSIQEEERKRIARELHDETSQVVAALNASLETASILIPTDMKKAENVLKKAQDLSVNILDGIHRLIYELRPSLLDDLGLVATARWLTETNLGVSGIEAAVTTRGRQRRLPQDIEATLFRVIQEAVTNIARHSGAKKASVRLDFHDTSIRVQIKDDGRGFNVDEAISSKDRPRGLGLVGMRERVSIVGGTLQIKTAPRRGGTLVKIVIPLDKEGESDAQS